MANVQQLVTEHIDIWTSAIEKKSATGRGSKKKIRLQGIQKLRELILELAVRGKLVPQDPNDEHASVLLEKIEEEKEKLIKEKKIKKQKTLPSISDKEKPFVLPEGWGWVRLGNIGFTQTGSTPKKSDVHHYGDYMPFIKPGDILNGKIDSYKNDGLSKEGAKSLNRIAPSDSVLMVCIGTIGKCARIDRSVSFNQQINSVSPYSNIGMYVEKVLQTPYFQRTAWKSSSSTTIAILNKGKWEQIPFALSPEKEQRRIVAKVDELMTLCDQLEQQTENSITAHQTLVETLLKTLTNSDNAEELQQNWARIEIHFDTLFTTEHSIDQLKQTILQLAAMGKLVPQDPNDEPASVLLEKIAEEKARLVEEGKIKKQKALSEITEKEIPFDLPLGWGWAKVDRFSHKITDGEHFRPQTQGDGVYFLSAKDIREDGVSLTAPLYVSQETAEKALQRCDPERGDILIVSRGATVGRMCTVDIDDVFCLLGSVILIKPVLPILSDYLKIVMKSPHIFERLVSASGSTAQPAIYLRDLKKIMFPIAPLAEQHRIVAKVDELMALCDSLKARITEAQTTQLHLANAIVEQAVN